MLSRRVLLLDASFEPLGVVGMPRAVRLVWRAVAEIVLLDGDRVLRSPRFSFPCPSVIRLVARVGVRRRRSTSLRTAILVRDRFRCQYCGRTQSSFELTLDHILPRSRGGRTTFDNLCASCRGCNTRKGDRTPSEARMPLQSDPSALRYDLELGSICYAARFRPEWLPYLESVPALGKEA